jgi:MFS family permease
VNPIFRSLRIPNYRRYAAGMFVSNTGTWMQRVAQDWLVLTLSNGSGAAVGITTALQFLPMLLFGLWGGVLADRYSKRRILALTNSFMGLVALTLGALVLSGAAQVWHVYVLAFALGLGAALDTPARQAFVVELVGREDLPNAVGLNSASFNGARILGPGLAGLLIVALGGTGWVFVLNAGTYLAPLAALRSLDTSALHPTQLAARARGQVREGLRYVQGRPDLVAILLTVFVIGTFGMNFQLTNALMATEEFGKGAREYGLLGSIMAVGSLAGALLGARRVRVRLRLVIGGAVGFGLVEICTGLMPSYPSYALALLPAGMLALTVMTSANALIQLSVDPAMRGRVMALYVVVFFGGTPIGAPLIGWLAEVTGPRWSLLAGGAVTALGCLAVAAWYVRASRVTVRPHLRPRPHVHVEPVA